LPKSARNKAADLEPDQASVVQGEHHQGRAQRQRPGARVELQGSAEFAANVPYAAAEAATLKVARVPIPAFDNAARAGDVFVEELQAAVLGRKGVAMAMDDVARRVKPLLP
jgi:multiple sugar transport system substrate-binding protein